MFDRLEGKRVLITGASRGLGAHVARALADQGMSLILSARDASKLDEVALSCRNAGAEVSCVSADICQEDCRERLLAEAGDLDVLVNNAGVEVTLGLTEQTAEDVRQQIETNLLAPIELTRLVLPRMISRGRGVVVNVSSMSGKGATPYNSIYAATKYGLNGFTASVAAELVGTGVHIGVICPSFVADAGMWAELDLKAPAVMREVPLEQVSKAVLRVIAGEREVLVTPTPMIRSLLALRELLPGLEARLLRGMGITRTLAERAKVARARRA